MTFQTTSGFILLGTSIGLHCVCLLALYLFHSRRALQPIRSRLYRQSEILGILFLITNSISVLSMEFESEISCTSFAATNIAMYSTLCIILLRGAHIYSAYAVSKLAVAKEKKLPSFKPHGVFVKRAYVFQSSRFQLFTFALTVATLSIIWTVGTLDEADGCTGLSPVIIAMLVASFVCVVFVVSIGWNIATLKDGLFLRFELFLVATVGSIASTVQTVTLVYFNSAYFTILANAIGFYLGFAAVIGMPLFKSYTMPSMLRQKHSKASKQNNNDRDTALRNYILKNPEEVLDLGGTKAGSDVGKLRIVLDGDSSYDQFLEFCRLELNHENPLFYREVLKFSSSLEEDPEFLDTEEFERKARYVYAKYIDSSTAPLQLNVPSRVLDEFVKAGFDAPLFQLDSQAAYTALRMALAEVFHLMLYDIFPRFKRTKIYKELDGL